MTSAGSRRRPVATGVFAAVLAGALLTGCGSGTPGSSDTPEVPTALTETPGPLPSSPGETAPVMPATETGVPTLPPGDPGMEPQDDGHDDEDAHGDAHENHEPRTDVPTSALLDVTTLEALLGQGWRETMPAADSCAAPRLRSALVSRTGGYASANGRLIETVTVHAGGEAAEQAVTTFAKRLATCGWTTEQAPLLGDAGVQARRSTSSGVERVVAVAAEGVTVTLVAAGPSLAPADKLAAVVDVAVSSSCPAAADGCH